MGRGEPSSRSLEARRWAHRPRPPPPNPAGGHRGPASTTAIRRLGHCPAMERGSPSCRSWADEVEDADLLAARSRGLNPDAEPFFGGSSPAGLGWSAGGKLSFSDSKASFGSELPTPDAGSRGKAPAAASGHRRRHRRRRRAERGFMADAWRTHPQVVCGTVERWGARLLSPPAAHPLRLSVEPDADGFCPRSTVIAEGAVD